MSSATIHNICALLSRPIPDPYVPPPKPANSWQRLRVCDVLILGQSWRLPHLQLYAGQRVRVARVDSGGMTLTGEPWDWEWRWEDPAWESWFTRAPRPRKPRAKKVVGAPNNPVDSPNTIK